MRQGPARRRRQTRSSFYNYEEDFDPDEIFRSFFYGTMTMCSGLRIPTEQGQQIGNSDNRDVSIHCRVLQALI
jgi:hypothetical protein